MFIILKNIFRMFKSGKYSLDSAITKMIIYFMCSDVKIGDGFLSKGITTLHLKRGSKIIFGSHIVINNCTTQNPIGLNKKSSIAVLGSATLRVGNYTGFSGVSIYCSNKIEIGNYCNFGGNVFIWDTDFHELDYLERRKNLFNSEKVKSEPIKIGNDVFVGANSIILKNVSIGDRAIIGAGSVITKSIPSDEIWAGNPAKFIRTIHKEE
ncbi:acyltransferase [Flavobacterium marginilacus]|uniref:acyltransferase n=1 Tax=Flavobacterium marginilacus TaxID=3003256 RepID=UPI00248E6D15|nr:acyltransferase [Flavobacterium marginilacus]